jgi:dTMP kinase
MNKSTKPNAFPGVMIEIAGCDGAGKTSNVPVLQRAFEELDVPVMTTREPGGTPLAEQVRNLVLHHQDSSEMMHSLTELMLFGAARAQHLTEKIYPALNEGIVVICDRFAMSTRAYQGHGRGMISAVEKMETLVHPAFSPDYVLFFDLPFEVSLERARLRNGAPVTGDRFEDATLELKKRIHAGFVHEINSLETRHPGRVVRIDATKSMEDIAVQLKVFTAFVAKMAGRLAPSTQATLEF